MESRTTFSREFKLEAVKLVTELGVAVAQAAEILDVHENVLRSWVRELREKPRRHFLASASERPRTRRWRGCARRLPSSRSSATS